MSVPADARLPVEDSARRRRGDQECRETDERRRGEQHRGRRQDVEPALGERRRPAERPDARLEQREVAHDAESQPPDHGLEGRGPHQQVGAPPRRDALRDLFAPPGGLRRQNDLVDFASLDDREQILDPSEDRQIRRPSFARADDPRELDSGPRVAADRVGDQSRRRPASDDQRAPPRLREETVEGGSPDRQQYGVQDEGEHEDRPRERIGLRQEIDRRQGRQLHQESREQQPRERLPEALVVAVEAEEGQRKGLDRRNDHDVPESEPDVPLRQEREGSRNGDAGPQEERGAERPDRDRDVAGEGDAAECRGRSPRHQVRAVRAHAGRLYPASPAATPRARATLSTAK